MAMLNNQRVIVMLTMRLFSHGMLQEKPIPMILVLHNADYMGGSTCDLCWDAG